MNKSNGTNAGDSTIYYNNKSIPRNIRWEGYQLVEGYGDKQDYSVDGVDSSTYTSAISGSTNEKSFDIWKYSKGESNVLSFSTLNETELTIEKRWDDEYDKDGLRPDSVCVEVTMPGTDEVISTAKITNEGGWKTVVSVKRYTDDGLLIYSEANIREVPIENCLAED